MTPEPRIFSEPEWQARAANHHLRVAQWIRPLPERRINRPSNPVHDFLFDYYQFRPSQLQRWHPGLDVILQGEAAQFYLTHQGYVTNREGVTTDPKTLKPERRASIRWLLAMLEASRDRPPFFGCSGLHEWAMLYKTADVRHSDWPLRFPLTAIAEIVESLPIRCTHFDAFRFFTDAARPLNKAQPTRAEKVNFEQRGCLHANMDLYKWAFKLTPFTPSELVADAFEFAREIREIDMRASPYDFSALGFAPIKIETPEGRAEYESHQRAFATRSEPLRASLITLCQQLVAAF